MNYVPETDEYRALDCQGECTVIFPQPERVLDPVQAQHIIQFRLRPLKDRVPSKEDVIGLHYESFKISLVTVEVL